METLNQLKNKFFQESVAQLLEELQRIDPNSSNITKFPELFEKIAKLFKDFRDLDVTKIDEDDLKLFDPEHYEDFFMEFMVDDYQPILWDIESMSK